MKYGRLMNSCAFASRSRSGQPTQEIQYPLYYDMIDTLGRHIFFCAASPHLCLLSRVYDAWQIVKKILPNVMEVILTIAECRREAGKTNGHILQFMKQDIRFELCNKQIWDVLMTYQSQHLTTMRTQYVTIQRLMCALHGVHSRKNSLADAPRTHDVDLWSPSLQVHHVH